MKTHLDILGVDEALDEHSEHRDAEDGEDGVEHDVRPRPPLGLRLCRLHCAFRFSRSYANKLLCVSNTSARAVTV